MLPSLARAWRTPWLAPRRAHSGLRALSSRSGAPPVTPDEIEAHEQGVRKLLEQREQLTQGRHRRRHFTPIEPGDQLGKKILEYEASARSNGLYKVAFKFDARHTKRSIRRLLERNAGKWRSFKAQLNDSLAALLDKRR